jgi:hypothetical protein
MQYVVVWTELVEADSHEEAVRKAESIFQSSSPSEVFVSVNRADAEPVRVDLTED